MGAARRSDATRRFHPDRLRTAERDPWHDNARSDLMSLSENLHKTRPEKKKVTVGVGAHRN
jgi:hypothetical protein